MPSKAERKKVATEGPTVPETYLNAWMDFTKEMGSIANEFVRRFGEEQQTNYNQWLASVQNSSKPRPSAQDIREVGERFQKWTALTQEIGQSVKDALSTGSALQKEFFSGTVRELESRGLSQDEYAKELSEIAHKFWNRVVNDLYQRSAYAFHPDMKIDEFIKSQEEELKEFAENIRKLTYTYFSSPPFPPLFSRTLDTAMETQRLMIENSGIFNCLASIPTKRDLAQLQEAMDAISARIERLQKKLG
jgi:hypothetical protein